MKACFVPSSTRFFRFGPGNDESFQTNRLKEFLIAIKRISWHAHNLAGFRDILKSWKQARLSNPALCLMAGLLVWNMSDTLSLWLATDSTPIPNSVTLTFTSTLSGQIEVILTNPILALKPSVIISWCYLLNCLYNVSIIRCVAWSLPSCWLRAPTSLPSLFSRTVTW